MKSPREPIEEAKRHTNINGTRVNCVCENVTEGRLVGKAAVERIKRRRDYLVVLKAWVESLKVQKDLLEVKKKLLQEITSMIAQLEYFFDRVKRRQLVPSAT